MTTTNHAQAFTTELGNLVCTYNFTPGTPYLDSDEAKPERMFAEIVLTSVRLMTPIEDVPARVDMPAITHGSWSDELLTGLSIEQIEFITEKLYTFHIKEQISKETEELQCQ